MATEYVETTINDRLIRIDKNDSMNVYIWRDWRIKTPKWVKKKVKLCLYKKYKKYELKINKKDYILSRVVYKAYNNDWDITDISKNNLIDHINRNPLDNRIENLRVLTSQQNNFNKTAKGYSWDKQNNKWHAQIKINYKSKHLGSFTEEADARQAYLKAKELYHKLPA